jgi:hypothetical protein
MALVVEIDPSLRCLFRGDSFHEVVAQLLMFRYQSLRI